VPRADVTVTFGAPKIGHAFFPGRGFCGRLVVEPIGFPASIIAAHAADRHWVDRDLARSWLPQLAPTAHKYTRGSVLVVAGSRRYTGAAALASLAALRAGAGIVQLATPESVRPILQSKLTEVIVHGVAETVDGSIAVSALDELRALLPRSTALVVGPGLGPSTATHDCVAALLDSAPMPAVVDADAIAALAAVTPGAARIVTPHAGELRPWGRAAGEGRTDDRGVPPRRRVRELHRSCRVGDRGLRRRPLWCRGRTIGAGHARRGAGGGARRVAARARGGDRVAGPRGTRPHRERPAGGPAPRAG
jgi:NAD(P)H-hydrate epimerase